MIRILHATTIMQICGCHLRLPGLPFSTHCRPGPQLNLWDSSDAVLVQIRKSSAPPEQRDRGIATYRDLIKSALASGNATVALPSMLLLLYQLTQ